ncbi:MAG: CBS domain-containing protein [Deltaproteobacteria bacterium]|nr:CBS domain-containing protein [Deltaproteobacteria bacterium]
MESMRVKDIMVPVEQYVTISEEATLYEAVVKLEEAQSDYEAGKCPHRAILVRARAGKVIGKMSKTDVIRSLEPKYSELGDLRKVSGFGLSPEFMKAMMEKFELWETPLSDLCRKAADLKVGSLVASPLEGEVIDADAKLDKAVHQIIVGHNQSLLVKSGDEVVGILRLTDVFQEIAKRIKLCKVQ